MKNDGALIYWIDRSNHVQSCLVHPHQLKGGSYLGEAEYVSDGAEHREVILLSRAGNTLERKLVEDLKRKAAQLRGEK